MSTTEWMLWAPRVQVLEIELIEEGRRISTQRAADGTFTIDRSLITGPYMLVLEGTDRILDPRATCVDEVMGPGRLVEVHTDVGSFRPVPLHDGIVYELHIGTFTGAGTFDAAIDKLDGLVALGITHVEIMPIGTWSGERNWGYDGAALFAPTRAYGGPAALQRFVIAAHARGLAVLLDVVYNHLGPIGNHLDRLGPYFRTDRHTPWGSALNFDGGGSDHVRRFFLDNALMWMRDYGCDGLRIDAIHAISDTSAHTFLAELVEEVALLGQVTGRPLCLIAESDLNDPRVVLPADRGGTGMDAQWCDDFHHALHVVLTGEKEGYYKDFAPDDGASPWACVARALEEGFLYTGQRSEARDRRHGVPLPETVLLSRLVCYTQTHDQVGNRAKGDRLSQLVSVGRQRIAAALLLTSPFVPMLFAGEEWGASTPFQFFTDHRDDYIADATRNGRQREFLHFGWKAEDIPDPQHEDTFLRSKLRWDEASTGQHADMLAWHRQLIALRHAEPEIRDGARHSIAATAKDALIIVRRGSYIVVANLGAPVDHELPSAARLVLAGEQKTTLSLATLHLATDGVAVVQLR
ncbi:MAG: malto-oligosyltrehalose trehalohydrolase [Polyangia bacterium]